jgi:hypothetical protein
VIDSVHSVLPHANSGAGKSREAPPRQSVSVHSGIGLLYNARVNRANPHNGIVDPEFEWNYGPTIFSLGVFDLGGQDRITAQIGHRLTGNQNHGLALRYGYYRGRVGAGADLIVSPKLGIYGNLYDLNIPTMDLEATYDIGKDYALMAGVDSINRDPRPIVGIRIKP